MTEPRIDYAAAQRAGDTRPTGTSSNNPSSLFKAVVLVLLSVIAGMAVYVAVDTYQRRTLFDRFCTPVFSEISVACAAMR